MRKLVTMLALTVVLAMSAAPAFAATGREFGRHHAEHATEMGGFTGGHNPGVDHRGYSDWTME